MRSRRRILSATAAGTATPAVEQPGQQRQARVNSPVRRRPQSGRSGPCSWPPPQRRCRPPRELPPTGLATTGVVLEALTGTATAGGVTTGCYGSTPWHPLQAARKARRGPIASRRRLRRARRRPVLLEAGDCRVHRALGVKDRRCADGGVVRRLEIPHRLFGASSAVLGASWASGRPRSPPRRRKASAWSSSASSAATAAARAVSRSAMASSRAALGPAPAASTAHCTLLRRPPRLGGRLESGNAGLGDPAAPRAASNWTDAEGRRRHPGPRRPRRTDKSPPAKNCC